MEWFLSSIQWYFYLLLLSIIFLPLTKRVFAKFSFDSGYAFSKVLSIIFLSYVVFVLGFLKILTFERSSIFLLIIVSIFINYYLWKKDRNKNSLNFRIIIFEEILFFVSFIVWTVVRGQEPSIHGLEKFMDFGFINSILRSKYFPPLDIWLSGYPINYYYFGHLTGAFLIKLTGINPFLGYNLILSTLFALGITEVFSIASNIVSLINKNFSKLALVPPIIIGLVSTFIVNLAGNLHTIYIFTKGYQADNPLPFWQILSGFNPKNYWYPNATRFIPFTIHEFPSYSYVVADLHGHVFDIPFVLLTIAILFQLFVSMSLRAKSGTVLHLTKRGNPDKVAPSITGLLRLRQLTDPRNDNIFSLPTAIFLGFLTAIHYMTNAFDGPIYLLLIAIIFLLIYKLTSKFLINISILFFSFVIFSLPFSVNFAPFATGIGINCSPDFLVKLKNLGPFIFEAGKCQATPFWMLFVLWGFFWISFAIFLFLKQWNRWQSRKGSRQRAAERTLAGGKALTESGKQTLQVTDKFMLILFSFGIFLIIIPIFFYIKDIYPAHFRANTMFKLGYQAFIIMGIASSYVFFRIASLQNFILRIILKLIYLISFGFIMIYPFFSIPSYYGDLTKKTELNGAKWILTSYPEDLEIVNYLNTNIQGQPIILEAQGDSYTDYERISSYTGLPTVAGWWVHEWLWRGSADVVGKRIPDIVNLYESSDQKLTYQLIKKYQIKYVIISSLERQKYKNIKESKFSELGRIVFKTSDGKGAIYQLN